MELLLADKLGYPKGFNGFEWSSLPNDGVKKSQMPSYLVEDLPNTDGFSIRQKFKEVSFAEAPKIEFFKPFIKSNYEIFRKDQQKKQKIKQLRQMKKDEKYMHNLIKREELKQYSVDLQKSINQNTYLSQNQQSENVLDKFISLTPTIQSKPNNNPILSMIKGKIIQERKEKKEKEKKKQQLIDDLHYYKIFADKYSRLTIECVDNISKLIGDDEGSQATDTDQKIDELRDSQILRDNLQKSEQKLNTLQERGSCLSQIQYQQQKNQLEDIIESKEQQFKASIDNTNFSNKLNMVKQDIMVSRTSQANNKSKSFLEVEINESKIRDNGNIRSRNSTVSQMPQNQEIKTYSSTMYGNSNQQQKRVSMINQLQNQQNRLDDSLQNFFKGDGILYKTFQRNRSQSKSHKNNNSFLQSTANTNLNFTNKTPQSKQNQLNTTNYNNTGKNSRSISSDIQINANLSKTPKQFSKTQNNFNNRFLTPQKTKQIDKQSKINNTANQGSLASQSINYENSYESKQINKNYHFQNQNNLNFSTGYKKDSFQSKTPKEQSSFLSTKNRYLTPDKKSLVDQSNMLNTQNYQDITIRKSINYDFDDQQSCFMALKQNPNKQMKNNYINPQQNVGNTQQRNQESPTFTEYSLHSEHKKSIILNNIRLKRESQIQNDKNNRSYIDPQFQEKSDVHHRSVMYAMKTLKKKFGLNKEKVQNKSSNLN
ncbi:hypothetical protein ABPG74_008842 [Tetrahymena malaccensis]